MSKNEFHSVSENRFLKTLLERNTKNIPKDLYISGKRKRDQQIDFAYEEVENKCITDLCEAETRDDVYDLLYVELGHIIDHYDLDIEAEDVLPFFWDVYRLKDAV